MKLRTPSPTTATSAGTASEVGGAASGHQRPAPPAGSSRPSRPRRPSRRTRLALVPLVAALALVVVACSDDEPSVQGETTESGDEASGGGITVGDSDLGEVLVDPEGLTLYIFTNDSDGTSVCNDACEGAWPPVPGDTDAGEGVDGAMLSSIERDDGSQQLAVNGRAVYTFSGDGAPGDVNGQDSGGVWYVVGADGEPIEG